MTTHKRKAAAFLVTGFGAVVLAISASTSFGFFYTYFDQLIPPAVLAPQIGALISGVVGVLLFDAACAIWLYTFLNHAETPEQRAISLIMTILTFMGAGAASVAYLGLTATGDLALDGATAETISTFALVVVIGGVIANFGAMQAYQRFSQENKEAVQEADLRDAVSSVKTSEKKNLVNLVAKNVREEISKMAPQIARVQAQQIAADVYREEMAKYANLSNQPPQTAVTDETAPADPWGEMGQYIWHVDDNRQTARPIPTRQPSTNGHHRHGRGA